MPSQEQKPEIKKRLLILTDSLGLPRPQPDVVTGPETWPQLLKKDFDVIQMSLGGATIEDIFNQTHYYLPFEPDLVLLQAGIVDCAPRALSRLEAINLNHFWVTRGALSKIMPKYGGAIRKFRHKVYTPLPAFEGFVQKIIDRFAPVPVYWIGIAPALPTYEEKVPGITANIRLYNQKLATLFGTRFIDLADLPASGIASDFHHLSVQGNQLLAARVLATLTPEFQTSKAPAV